MADWVADAGPVKVELTNAARIAAGLKVAPAAMKRELRVSNTKTAKEVQRWIRAGAAQASPQQRHMQNGIVGAGNSTQAVIRLVPRGKSAGVQGAFFGAKKYAQFPPWVGNTWTPATAGQGPYVINPTLARHLADIETIYNKGQLDALTRALPRF